MRLSHLLLTCSALLMTLVATVAPVAAADKGKKEADAKSESAEAPSAWPIEYRLPDELWEEWFAYEEALAEKFNPNRKKKKRRKKISADSHIQLWVPPESERIRAIFIMPNNTDSFLIGEHPAVRKVAAKHHMAIIHFKAVGGAVIEGTRSESPALAEKSFNTILDIAATESGIDDLRHAPWITLGKSSRGKFPFRTAWWNPSRVIATIAYHGEVPTYPMEKWSTAADESILHCSVNGLTEWDGTWFRAVRPGILNYHHNTKWLGHQAVIMGVDHGYYPDYYLYPTFRQPMPQKMPGVPKLARSARTWDYLAAFIDAALTLRVPADTFPEGAPIKLNQVDRSSGYLIHPRAIEEILGTKWFAFRQSDEGFYQSIRWPDEVTPVYDTEQGIIPFDQLVNKASDVPAEEQADYMWIADLNLLTAWLDLHNSYKVKTRILESVGVEPKK